MAERLALLVRTTAEDVRLAAATVRAMARRRVRAVVKIALTCAVRCVWLVHRMRSAHQRIAVAVGVAMERPDAILETIQARDARRLEGSCARRLPLITCALPTQSVVPMLRVINMQTEEDTVLDAV